MSGLCGLCALCVSFFCGGARRGGVRFTEEDGGQSRAESDIVASDSFRAETPRGAAEKCLRDDSPAPSAVRADSGRRKTDWIRSAGKTEIAGRENVRAPFENIADHVVEAPGVRRLRSDGAGIYGQAPSAAERIGIGWNGIRRTVPAIPRDVIEFGLDELHNIAERPPVRKRGGFAGAAGALPFRFGRQTVFVSVRNPARGAFPLVDPAAEFRRLRPRNPHDRKVRLARSGERNGIGVPRKPQCFPDGSPPDPDIVSKALPRQVDDRFAVHHRCPRRLRDLRFGEPEVSRKGDADGVLLRRHSSVFGTRASHPERPAGHRKHLESDAVRKVDRANVPGRLRADFVRRRRRDARTIERREREEGKDEEEAFHRRGLGGLCVRDQGDQGTRGDGRMLNAEC